LGWRFHQSQQRTLDDMGLLINQRRANVNGFYTTEDVDTALGVIHFYDIKYIILGGLERAYYPEERLAKFELMVDSGLLEKVYEQGEATVYRVLDALQIAQVDN
jgi:uncharacterized membrane protein